ncbi:MAG: glycosyltransferase [Planctomycetota bacterium]
MKILHLITTLGAGGAENHLFLLAREQRRQGHQVQVAYFRASGNLREAFEQVGIPVHSLEGSRYLSLKALYRLARLLSRYHPEILHTHLFSGDLYGAILGKMWKIHGIISTKHNQDQYLKTMGIKQLAKWVSILDHQVIAISDAVKQFTIAQLNYPPHQALKKFTRIYYGVDLEELDNTHRIPFSREAFGIPPNALILGTIGRLTEQKGYPYLIDAFAQLRQEFPWIYLIALGRGDQEQKIREEIQNKGLNESFLLLGYHSERSKVLGYLEAMDIFVLPSLWEGFGLVLAEAMALRKPIVASTAGSIPEVVTEDCGYLVPPKDVESLRASLQKLIQNPEQRVQMGNSGRRRVEQFFSVKAMVEQTERLYRHYL